MFSKLLYLQVYVDRLLIRDISSANEVEIIPDAAFSHPRALLGNFVEADKALKLGLNKIGKGFIAPVILLHPMERIEGGLSQIEERAFHELAMGAGARRVKIWTGSRLTDSEVELKIKEK